MSQTSQTDLSEFLDVRVGDIAMPTVLATGLYKFVITRYGLDRAANDKRTPFVRATFKPVEVIQADEEVDLDTARTVAYDFWRTPAADKIALDFFQRKLKLEVTADSNFSELWEEAIGCEVIGEVEQNVSTKGNPFAKIIRFSHVE